MIIKFTTNSHAPCKDASQIRRGDIVEVNTVHSASVAYVEKLPEGTYRLVLNIFKDGELFVTERIIRADKKIKVKNHCNFDN